MSFKEGVVYWRLSYINISNLRFAFTVVPDSIAYEYKDCKPRLFRLTSGIMIRADRLYQTEKRANSELRKSMINNDDTIRQMSRLVEASKRCLQN